MERCASTPFERRIVDALDYHLDQRPVESLAVGPDAYSRVALEHPMALAMYIRGSVALARLTGDSGRLEVAGRLADRLQGVRARVGGDMDAWGLAFRWRGTPATEPYPITSALCTLALADLYAATTDRLLLPRVARAARWLASGTPWSVLPGGAGPWYSRRLPHVVPNVAAVTAGALMAAWEATGDDRLLPPAEAADLWVRAQSEAPGVWLYGYTGSQADGPLRSTDVIDSLHTAYVIDGLVSVAERGGGWDPDRITAVRSGVRFLERHLVLPSGALREKVVLVRHSDSRARPLLDRPALGAVALDGRRSLACFPAEGRLWNYGAVLASLARARFARVAVGGAIEPLVDRLLSVHAARADGRFSYLPSNRAAYPRHESHAYDGLAQAALTIRALADAKQRQIP